MAKVSAVVSLAGAIAILAFVVVSYLQRDVVQFRGVVLSFMLVGLGLVVWPERHGYVVASKSQHLR